MRMNPKLGFVGDHPRAAKVTPNPILQDCEHESLGARQLAPTWFAARYRLELERVQIVIVGAETDAVGKRALVRAWHTSSGTKLPRETQCVASHPTFAGASHMPLAYRWVCQYRREGA